MDAIILAGGQGSRLRGCIPKGCPKPMAPIKGRPFLEIILRHLADCGFKRAILSLGYGAEQLSEHFGDRFCGMALAYVREEQPLGTGGGARFAMTAVQSSHVFIFNGDTWLDENFAVVARQRQRNGMPIIIGRQVPDVSRYGCLILRKGMVVGIEEKTQSGSGLVNAGSYVLDKGQLDEWAVGEKFSLERDFLAKTLLQQPFDLFVAQGDFIDIGTPEDYARAQEQCAAFGTAAP